MGSKAPAPGGLVQVLNSSGKKRDKGAADEGRLYKKDKGGKQSKHGRRDEAGSGKKSKRE